MISFVSSFVLEVYKYSKWGACPIATFESEHSTAAECSEKACVYTYLVMAAERQPASVSCFLLGKCG